MARDLEQLSPRREGTHNGLVTFASGRLTPFTWARIVRSGNMRDAPLAQLGRRGVFTLGDHAGELHAVLAVSQGGQTSEDPATCARDFVVRAADVWLAAGRKLGPRTKPEEDRVKRLRQVTGGMGFDDAVGWAAAYFPGSRAHRASVIAVAV